MPGKATAQEKRRVQIDRSPAVRAYDQLWISDHLIRETLCMLRRNYALDSQLALGGVG